MSSKTEEELTPNNEICTQLIKKTNTTPFVCFNYLTGILKIVGNSYPVNSADFYKPIFNWVEAYFNKPQRKTVIHVQLTGLNADSQVIILSLLKFSINKAEEKKAILYIDWICESVDTFEYEVGMVFKGIFKNTFHLIVGD